MHLSNVVVHIKAPGGARHPGLFHDLRAADWRAVHTLKEFITANFDGRIDTDERWYCVNSYTKTWISMACYLLRTLLVDGNTARIAPKKAQKSETHCILGATLTLKNL